MQQGSCFTCNTPAPSSCPTPTSPTPCPSTAPVQEQRSCSQHGSRTGPAHARRHRKGNGAGATSALDNQISAWDFPVGYCHFPHFVNNMTSMIRGVTTINTGGIAGQVTEQATRHRWRSQSSASAPGAWQELLRDAEKLEQGGERKADDICFHSRIQQM